MSIIKATAKINSIFLAVVLIVGTFAAVYPSFIIGVQAQAEYGYDNNSYNSEYPPSEYPPSEYPPSDYESNQENDYYNYPPTEDPVSVDIVVPIDFDTIQEAINAANEGDVIQVLPGTYIEQITINKTLTIIGSGAKSTIIEAPPLEELEPGIVGPPSIINIDNEAKVNIKGFSIKGIEGTNCDGLFGIVVLGDATLKLDSVIIQDCTNVGVLVGSIRTPIGPQSGHAIIKNTLITDYRSSGVVVPGSGSTLTISHSKIIGSAPDAFGVIGISFHSGAKAKIVNNIISENICDLPECGPDPFTQVQAFGIAASNAGNGSVIADNYVSNNDVGIGVFGESGCCIVDKNKLTDNRFFGIVIVDGEHTISNTKIFGGQVGASAIAFSSNTTATLDRIKIVDAEIPIQALSTGNLTAAVNVTLSIFLSSLSGNSISTFFF